MEKADLFGVIIREKSSVLCADNYRKIHQFYCENRERLQPKYAIAPGFIQYTNRAVKHGVIIELMRLFDDSSFNIDKLCNECKKHSKSFRRYVKIEGTPRPFSLDETIMAYKNSIKPYRKAISNLRVQRNTIWAHTDTEYIKNPLEAEDKFPVSWGEIEEIIEIVKTLLVNLEQGLTGSGDVFQFADGQDVNNLFDRIVIEQEADTDGQA